MLPPTYPTSALLRTRRVISSARGLTATACLVGLLGCSEAQPDRVAVHPAAGVFTFKGQPAHGASLTLHPKAAAEDVPAPRASVDKDGSFKLSTFNGGDGAPEGDYVVTVRWYKLVKQGSDLIAGPNVIPRKYTDPQSSDLTIRIAAGENALPPIKL
jgi:hypothetical protein